MKMTYDFCMCVWKGPKQSGLLDQGSNPSRLWISGIATTPQPLFECLYTASFTILILYLTVADALLPYLHAT